MRKENGLKRIYRFGGIGISRILLKISKSINPNTITISGFIVFIIGWMQYLIFYLFYEIVFLNKIFFIIALNIALIIDYCDGEYAKKVNKCTELGDFLDGVLDIIKISLTYVLLYFTSDTQIIKLMIFFLSVIFTISMWIRYHKTLPETPSKEGKFLTIKLLFGYSIVHQYLYFSIFLIFGLWQILLLPLLLGLITIFNIFKKLIKMARILDKKL